MWRLIVCVAAVGLVACVSSCTFGPTVTSSTKQRLPQPGIGMPPLEPMQLSSEESAPQPSAELQAILDKSVAEVVQAYGGVAEVSIVGAIGEYGAGDAGGFAAWSTIKVPIAIAALKTNPGLAQQAALAIQTSDNPAAMTLWNSTTPEAVEEVLAQGGAPITVQRQYIRPEFSPFGQTKWTVAEQARFASHLRCVDGAGPVLELMGSITAGQSYGLGTLPAARFKGGWGPSALNGGYEVRQFGLVQDKEGRDVAIALAVRSGDGSYASGQTMASQLAALIRPALDTAPAAHC